MKKRLIHLILLGILTLACNLPFQVTFNSPTETPTEPPSDLALTVTAQVQLLAEVNNAEVPENNSPQSEPHSSAQATNTPIPLPTITPTIAASPTLNTTATPTTPMISVSLDTNCRTGPGKAYDIVGALLVGETAEITGKNTSSGYWIVKNPDTPSKTCWLWGQYATVAGDQRALAEVSIPPTPTPVVTIPKAPSNLSETSVCYDYQTQVSAYLSDGTLTWKDNSNNEDGFTVYQENTFVAGSSFYPIATLGPNITSYRYSAGHYGVAGSVKFKVEAFNSAGVASSGTISPDMSICP